MTATNMCSNFGGISYSPPTKMQRCQLLCYSLLWSCFCLHWYLHVAQGGCGVLRLYGLKESLERQQTGKDQQRRPGLWQLLDANRCCDFLKIY